MPFGGGTEKLSTVINNGIIAEPGQAPE